VSRCGGYSGSPLCSPRRSHLRCFNDGRKFYSNPRLLSRGHFLFRRVSSPASSCFFDRDPIIDIRESLTSDNIDLSIRAQKHQSLIRRGPFETVKGHMCNCYELAMRRRARGRNRTCHRLQVGKSISYPGDCRNNGAKRFLKKVKHQIGFVAFSVDEFNFCRATFFRVVQT